MTSFYSTFQAWVFDQYQKLNSTFGTLCHTLCEVGSTMDQ